MDFGRTKQADNHPIHPVQNPPSFNAAGRLVGCLGIAGGTLFGLIGISMFAYNAAKYSGMERAEGVAIRYERGREGMGGKAPHVEFTASDERIYVISRQGESSSFGGGGIAIGQKVSVLYNPEDPNEGILDLFMEKWFNNIMFVGVGFGVMLMAILMSRAERKQAAK